MNLAKTWQCSGGRRYLSHGLVSSQSESKLMGLAAFMKYGFIQISVVSVDTWSVPGGGGSPTREMCRPHIAVAASRALYGTDRRTQRTTILKYNQGEARENNGGDGCLFLPVWYL